MSGTSYRILGDGKTWWSGRCPKCGYEEPKVLKINIYGGGSAGQRHAKMLRERGCECRIYDPNYKRESYIHYPLLYDSPDAVVIASPPETHESYLRQFWNKCPILCEGPVTAFPGEGTSAFPHMTASNWLFVPQIRNLYQNININRPPDMGPVSAHLWFDYDLAKWRGPGWDYKTSCYYESGIDLINCHEAMTALWMFGPAEEVKNMKTYTAKSKGADALICMVRHKSGVLTTINSGWHAAQYQRGIRVVFKDGSVEELGWSSPQDDVICNQSYTAMLDHWLEAIRTHDVNVRPSLLDGYRAYKLMQGEAIL